jgi:HEAT repeat protein
LEHAGVDRALRCAVFAAALAAAYACRPGVDQLSSPDPVRRASFVSRLGSSRDEADLPALLVAQDDPSALVRKAAAGAFAARGGPAAIEALGKLAADLDPDVAVAAARALSGFPAEPRALDRLVAAYAGAGPVARTEIAVAMKALGGSLRDGVELEARVLWERNVRVLESGTPAERAGAAEDLGRSGRAAAVRILAPLLEPERGEDPRVIAAAVRGLGAAGDRASRPAVEALLQEAKTAALAEAAAEALGALGDPASAAALGVAGSASPGRLGAPALEALAAMPQATEVARALCQLALHSVDPRLAAGAAAQARTREGECPEGPLLARLTRGGREAVTALAALGELRFTPEIEKAHVERLLASPDAAIRAATARTLGRLGVAGAASALTQRAADAAQRLARARTAQESAAEHEVAAELAELIVALARVHAEGAREVAAAHLGDPSEELRAAAVEAMGAYGREEIRRIGPALGDPSERVWTVAAEALGRIGPPAVPVLAQAVAGARPDDPRSTALARALGETGVPEAVPALAALARGRAAAAVASALGRIGTRDAQSALRAFLTRPGAAGRVEAIDALGALGVGEAGPEIGRQLTSDRPTVRAAAARALGRLRQDAGGGWLEALRSDYDAEVRRAAVEALAKLPSARAAR